LPQGGGTTWEELLRRAYDLAYFLHADRDVALQVAVEALAKLDLAARAQAKRMYYRPVGRPAGDGRRSSPLRSKVVMSRPQLLQRLVYVESERFERQRAERGELDRAARVVLFVKHLVRVSARRNCLYVTVAVARLLYGYSTAESMELLAVLLQDPGRVPDDSYFRSVKKRLIEELRERFPDLRTERCEHGEERFAAADDAAHQRPLVTTCLRRFVPWSTRCAVPDGFAADEQTLPDLVYGGDPDREHPREMNRMHGLLHPRCFARLVRGLALREPDEGLQLPRFAEDEHASGLGTPSRGEPPELSAADLAAAGRELRRRHAALRSVRRDALSLDVDGREADRWHPARPASLHLALPHDPELLEVRAWRQGRHRLVAVHLPAPRPLLAGATSAAARDEEAVLATGWGSSLRLALSWRGESELGWCRLEATYRPSILDRLAAWRPSRWTAPRNRLAAGLAAALLSAVLLTTGLVWFHAAPPPTLVPPTHSPAVPASPLRRGPQGPWRSLALGEVESIFLDDLGDAVQQRQLAAELRTCLQGSGRFRLSGDRETADALLTRADGTPGGLPALRLLDAAGDTLWTWRPSGADPAAAAVTACADLSAAARKEAP